MKNYIVILCLLIAGCLGPSLEERTEIAFSEYDMASLTYKISRNGKKSEITVDGSFTRVSEFESAMWAIEKRELFKSDDIVLINKVRLNEYPISNIVALSETFASRGFEFNHVNGQVIFSGLVSKEADLVALENAIKGKCFDRKCPEIIIEAKVKELELNYISKKFAHFYSVPNGKKLGRMIGGQIVEVVEKKEGWTKVKLIDAKEILDVWVKDSGLQVAPINFNIGYREFLVPCSFGLMEEWISKGGNVIGLMSCEAVYLYLKGLNGGSTYFKHYKALGFVPVKILVPSDPSASYVMISKQNLRDYVVGDVLNSVSSGEYNIVVKRVGRSGTSYTRREINCNNFTQRYLGDGDTIREMNGYYNVGRMTRPVTRSISYYVQQHVCK